MKPAMRLAGIRTHVRKTGSIAAVAAKPRAKMLEKLKAIGFDSRLAGDFAQGATAGDGTDPVAVLIAGIRGGAADRGK